MNLLEIDRQPNFPKGAQYALLTKDGKNAYAFYKKGGQIITGGGTIETVFYYSDFPWQRSSQFNTMEEVYKHHGDCLVKIK